ncbi:MAG: flagellar hook-basal body complex protein, partial [Solirubrobacteraceae bacterium]|nr:flagellar hook-basal body complex protein [Solirubrobacteraceae bacterium]
DQIANDLANAATPGYKADRSAHNSFGSLLVTDYPTGSVVGELSRGVRVDRQETDFTSQPVRETSEPLDLAVVGEGFFAIQTPEGLRYTRNGSFQAAANGTLTDQLGNAVLGPNGQPVQVPAAGATLDPATVGVSLVPDARKAGNGYFTGNATGQAEDPPRQGALESSSVDPARTMVDMMASLRAFEAGQKAITTIDSTLDKAANQVGSLR